MNDKLNEAIEKVKHLKRFLMVYEDIHQVTLMTGSDKEAIDTVVSELTKPFPTDEQIKQSITEAVEKEKECIRQFLIDDGYELLADKI